MSACRHADKNHKASRRPHATATPKKNCRSPGSVKFCISVDEQKQLWRCAMLLGGFVLGLVVEREGWRLTFKNRHLQRL
jgi:hypothetical protein